MEMQQIIEMLTEMKADREADQQQMLVKMEANTKAMREVIRSSQAEMRSIVDVWMTDIKDGRKKTITCHEVTEADTENMEPDPGMVPFIEKQQGIPKREAAVMPDGGLRKRRRIRKLAAERPQKP
jgi:hypothetical protein